VTGQAHKISLGQDLGLRDADRLRGELLSALLGEPIVEIHCHDLTGIDLSIVQVFIAADKMAKGRNQTLRILARSDGPLGDALSRAGLSTPSRPVPFEVHWDGSNSTI
jgi:anti-anti-sigma regulatory factor